MDVLGEVMSIGGDSNPVVRGVESFEVFYRREYSRCVGLAYVLSGSRSGAEDLTQDAFLEAHRRWVEVGAYENPEAWVRRVISNRAVSRYRRRLAEAKALARMVRGEHSSIPELANDTEEVWDAVRGLPRRQAQAIALTYLEGLSLEEVAAVLGISVPTVGTHLQRARKALAVSLHVSEEVN